MAKKPTKQPERIRCADCVHGKPHKGLAVWCEILNTGRVANSIRYCDNYKRQLI